ncbi:hypothetical protein F4805DRAFT_450966, partial [Annulohypoxylon moriforme]
MILLRIRPNKTLYYGISHVTFPRLLRYPICAVSTPHNIYIRYLLTYISHCKGSNMSSNKKIRPSYLTVSTVMQPASVSWDEFRKPNTEYMMNFPLENTELGVSKAVLDRYKMLVDNAALSLTVAGHRNNNDLADEDLEHLLYCMAHVDSRRDKPTFNFLGVPTRVKHDPLCRSSFPIYASVCGVIEDKHIRFTKAWRSFSKISFTVRFEVWDVETKSKVPGYAIIIIPTEANPSRWFSNTGGIYKPGAAWHFDGKVIGEVANIVNTETLEGWCIDLDETGLQSYEDLLIDKLNRDEKIFCIVADDAMEAGMGETISSLSVSATPKRQRVVTEPIKPKRDGHSGSFPSSRDRGVSSSEVRGSVSKSKVSEHTNSNEDGKTSEVADEDNEGNGVGEDLSRRTPRSVKLVSKEETRINEFTDSSDANSESGHVSMSGQEVGVSTMIGHSHEDNATRSSADLQEVEVVVASQVREGVSEEDDEVEMLPPETPTRKLGRPKRKASEKLSAGLSAKKRKAV